MILDSLHGHEMPFINDGPPVGWAFEVPTLVSLAVIAVALALTAVVSLSSSRRRPDRGL